MRIRGKLSAFSDHDRHETVQTKSARYFFHRVCDVLIEMMHSSSFSLLLFFFAFLPRVPCTPLTPPISCVSLAMQHLDEYISRPACLASKGGERRRKKESTTLEKRRGKSFFPLSLSRDFYPRWLQIKGRTAQQGTGAVRYATCSVVDCRAASLPLCLGGCVQVRELKPSVTQEK